VRAPVTVTGNPARPAFVKYYRRSGARARSQAHDSTSLVTGSDACRSKRLIVLGGAGGARSLNESMPGALKRLGDSLSDWQIVHQTGEGQLQATESRYRESGVPALAVSFIDEIASILFASDLVVCRSGGTCLAELALAGAAAVLVPYPHASDNHHLANAKVIASAGAGRLVDENSQSGALDIALAKELLPVVTDEEVRQQMSRKMRGLARPQASAEVAAAIHDTLFSGRSRLLAA